MAKPAKRRVEGTGQGSRTDDTATDTDASAPKDTATRKDTAKDTGTVRTSSKRVTPKAQHRPSGRYTPPGTGASKGPSPRWVPVLMFALWGLGLLVIILNYMGVLPGSADGGNGWYLVAGLGAILAGIMVATQYR